MARFNRTKASWPNGFVPQEADFNDLDEKTKKSLNADEGGTWSPTDPIEIGGAGTILSGGVLHKISGAGTGLQLESGALLRTTEPGTLELGGGATDWPRFMTAGGANAPRTRSRLMWIQPATGPGDPGAWSVFQGQILGNNSIATITLSLGNLPEGATLTSVRIYMRVVWDAARADIPQYLPALGVIRQSVGAGPAYDVTQVFLGSPDYQDMYVPGIDSAARLAFYRNESGFGGHVIEYICSANHTILANAVYGVLLRDEYGTNSLAGSAYNLLEVTYSVPDLRTL